VFRTIFRPSWFDIYGYLNAYWSIGFGEKEKEKAICSSLIIFVLRMTFWYFAAGSSGSVQAILGALNEFEDLSGLKANPSKSYVFIAGVPPLVKQRILHVLQMPEGVLPMRYLGVPLITKRLSAVDCESLITKISSRIDSWLVTKLSFAGRLQLLSSVLLSLQFFRARVYSVSTDHPALRT
jgi:hypothetical protein